MYPIPMSAILVLFPVFLALFIPLLILLRRTRRPTANPPQKDSLTGKRTCKVLSPLIRGKNETCYVVLEDITNPESPIAFVLNQERIHNTEQDGSSVGLSKLSQDGVYTISDKPFLQEHAYAQDGEYDYFASRIY